MKHKHGSGANRGLGGRIAAALMGAVCALCVSATPALAVEASITNTRTKATYKDLATATAEAQSGDTIKLGEGIYTATFENEAFETQTKAEPIAKLPAAPNKPGKADVKPAQNKVTPATPQTGDQTNLAIPVAIAVIGIVVVAGAVIIRRRNK